jgi:SAM-dependent methyltransferase
LLLRQLRPARGETLLDVGCGTGYFTQRFADESGLHVVGLDPNAPWLEFARAHGTGTGTGSEKYCVGVAESLPFADRSFDLSVSVTALCFVDDARRALQEILRVTRKRFAIGLLNRHSLLFLRKGLGGGSGAYRGAHWHTAREIRALFAGLPAANLTLRSAVFLPEGGQFARRVESLIPDRLRLGAFIVAAGDVR